MIHSWKTQFYQNSDIANPTLEMLSLHLRSGQINQNDYYAWAMDHYQLALLNSSFFEQNGISDAYRLTDHLLGNWGVTQVPIQIWDAVLYVACLSPEEVPKHLGPYTVQPLLALAHDIENLWEQVKPKIVKREFSFPNMPSKSISSVVHFPTPKNETQENSSLDLLYEGEPAEVLEAESSLSKEVLNHPTEIPEGLNIALETPKEATLFPEIPEDLPNSSQDPIPFSAVDNSAWNQENPELEKIIEDAFAEVLNFYEKAILFHIHSNSAVGITATNNIKQPAENHSYNLDTPNVFRIVYTTQKPFHGKIHINEVNERFLIDWLEAKNPELLTLVPIILGGEVQYMIAAATDQEVDKAAGLKVLLDIAFKVTEKAKTLNLIENTAAA